MNEDEQDLQLSIPGHVSVKRTSEMLGVSYARVLQLIRGKRLSAQKVSGMYMIPIEAIEEFQKRPPGRARKQGAEWHLYSNRIRVFDTLIQVHVREGQQQHFMKRVRQLYSENQHTFKGTMIRVIRQSVEHPEQVTILLVWKNNEMPDEETRQRELAAFQHDFADVLDWDTAHIEHGNVLLST